MAQAKIYWDMENYAQVEKVSFLNTPQQFTLLIFA